MGVEKYNFKVGAVGEGKKKYCNLKPLNLEKLLNWIDSQSIEEHLKVELKKSASAYPHQALESWQKNFAKHVSTAQAKVRKLPKPRPKKAELGEEENFNEEENYPTKDPFDAPNQPE